jgi:shikimate kinase
MGSGLAIMLSSHYGARAAIADRSVCPSDHQSRFTVSDSDIPKPDRTITLVGLMGAGKSTVGRRLATRLDLPFVDADSEIEAAAGCTIPEIFERHGEAEFRAGERRVIARLLRGRPKVLATGGGAFMDADTRQRIKSRAISVWLRADLDLLMARVARRDNRPLLKQGDPRQIMERLMAERYPVYGEADITVESNEGPHDAIVERIIDALRERSAAS